MQTRLTGNREQMQRDRVCMPSRDVRGSAIDRNLAN
jgi:hypothetical protein